MTTVTPFTVGEIAEYYRVRAPHLAQRGKQWRGPCPLHQGKGNSLSVSRETGHWYCFADCGSGGSLIDFEMRLTSGDFRTALRAVYGTIGRPIPRGGSNADIRRKQYDRCEAERDEQDATYFARTAAFLIESELERLPVESPDRRFWTKLLKALRMDPVAVFRRVRASNEPVARVCVDASKGHQKRVQIKIASVFTQICEAGGNATR